MKRSKTYDDSISKKFKGNGNLDELWGEDLDVNDVDDCFKLITENLAGANFTCTQRNNVSIVPSYNIFRTEKLNETSTSTQIAQLGTSKIVAGSTFKRYHSFENATSNHLLEAKVKKLEESCLAKEGEVNILRSQIREMRKTNEKDYVKKQSEWNDKLNEAKTKLNEATSALEFKNLEIVNLKQQFDMLKVNGLSQQPSTSKEILVSEPKAVEDINCEDGESEDLDESDVESEIEIFEEEEFPLEDVFPASTFDSVHRETFMMEFEEESEEYKRKHKRREHPNPYMNLDLQRYYSKVEELQPKVTYLRKGRLLNFAYLHSDLSVMMKFSSKELELEENHWYFNKLLCTSEQLMDNFYQYLLTVQRGMLKFIDEKDEDPKEDPVVYDLNLSPLISNHWYYNELGISARQGIACIAEILPHSSYLRAYMLLNENLKWSEEDDHLNCLPVTRRQKESNYKNKHNFLQQMRLAILIIKRLELECYTSGFLCSVISLINKSCTFVLLEEATETYLFDLIFLMFSGKSTPGTCAYSLEYARALSNKIIFVDRLCKFPENKHSCILSLFFEQVEKHLFQIKDIDLEIPSVNLMDFSLNIFRHNPRWINNRGYRGCNCLKKFITTTVFVIYKLMKKYQDNLDECTLTSDTFCDTNLLSKCISLLHLLTSKCHNLLVKCVDTFTQYNNVIQMIIDSRRFFEEEQQEEITTLEALINNENLPPVNLEKLYSIEAWNTLNSAIEDTMDVDFVRTDTDAPATILPSCQPVADPKDHEFLMPNPKL